MGFPQVPPGGGSHGSCLQAGPTSQRTWLHRVSDQLRGRLSSRSVYSFLCWRINAVGSIVVGGRKVDDDGGAPRHFYHNLGAHSYDTC